MDERTAATDIVARLVEHLPDGVLGHGWDCTVPDTVLAAAVYEIESLRGELDDARRWLQAFVDISPDPGVGALAWLARNHRRTPESASTPTDGNP